MIKSILSTMQDFESSSQKTPQYLAWFKLFKKEFTELLVNKFCISNANIFTLPILQTDSKMLGLQTTWKAKS